MENLPLSAIPSAALKLFSAPMVFVDSVLAGVRLEWMRILQTTSEGGMLTVGMLLPLIKWVALLLFILAVVIFILYDTVKRVIYTEPKPMPISAIISDSMVIILVLLIYYATLSFAIYVFFNFLLPLYKNLE